MKTSRFVIPILAYHQITGNNLEAHRHPALAVRATSFSLQMFLLRALGYQTIGFSELVPILLGQRRPSRHPCMITFDDGYSGVFHYGLPILQKYGLNATVFLIAEDFCPQKNLSERAYRVMTRLQVRDWLAAGSTIGSHSLTHAELDTLDASGLFKETRDSKRILEEVFGIEAMAFAYPYGRFNRDVIQMVKESSYAAAVTTTFGRIHQPTECFWLKRIPVGSSQGIIQFLYRLLSERDYNIAGQDLGLED